MKILVTGATGFIGRHVIPKLLARGHTITAIARDIAKARSFIWYGQVCFIACDIHNGGAVDQIGHHDAVIHLAWSGLPNYKALFHFEKNLPNDYRFLKSLIESGIDHLLVTGTCFEYGMQSGQLTEDLPTFPANSYALAKDCLRKFLQELQSHHVFTLQWPRLFYMYGEGQNSNSLIAQLDHSIDTGETTFNMSGGEQLRDYLPVQEVARLLVMLVENPEFDGVINVCRGKPISVRRLVEQRLAARGADIQLNFGFFPYPDYEPMAFWGDNTKYFQFIKADNEESN